MEGNNILVQLDDHSYFGPGSCATMHFHKNHWAHYDCVYPEIVADSCNTRVEDFCMPPDAEYEIVRADSGEIIIRVFAKEMRDSPVLEWVFPDPDSTYEDIYKDFARGL